jgi:hypothetical protein
LRPRAAASSDCEIVAQWLRYHTNLPLNSNTGNRHRRPLSETEAAVAALQVALAAAIRIDYLLICTRITISKT